MSADEFLESPTIPLLGNYALPDAVANYTHNRRGADGLEPMPIHEMHMYFDWDEVKRVFTPKRRENPDLILAGLFLGDQRNAYSRHTLEKFNITHVLSVLSGVDVPVHRSKFSSRVVVDTIIVPDEAKADISQHFTTAIAVIDKALQDGENILVHCAWGMSRSATVVIAYLMYKFGINLTEAMRHVRDSRPIATLNPGFKQQLVAWSRRVSSVEFSVRDVETQWGESVFIVGSSAELGNWTCTKANQMKWVAPGIWKAQLPVYAHKFEYKYVIAKCADTEVGTLLVDEHKTWEGGLMNRVYDGSRHFLRESWDLIVRPHEAPAPAEPPAHNHYAIFTNLVPRRATAVREDAHQNPRTTSLS
ncbi:dual specificity protein phosphatase 1 [Pelomyxa schiedti]|nr:dual specificity protein phosphatase 1 [Pelomyxa schiedti]